MNYTAIKISSYGFWTFVINKELNGLTVKIEVRANVLDEVIINPNALTGNLNHDSNNIKITQINPQIDNNKEIAKLYLGDEKTSPENKLMPGYLDTTYMMDFKALGGKLIHLLKKKDRFNSEKVASIPERIL